MKTNKSKKDILDPFSDTLFKLGLWPNAYEKDVDWDFMDLVEAFLEKHEMWDE